MLHTGEIIAMDVMDVKLDNKKMIKYLIYALAQDESAIRRVQLIME